ncbi:MAG: phosphoglycerate mutase family protein [Patescibacteria group bacterium]|nr:phosphoglycerate mutase family protein [Patescibacteria group bacterium]
MHRILVPKGTRVVLMRHAITDWNEETIKALLAGRQKPPRLPGRRNAPLSAMGHMQAYFAAKYLAREFSPRNFARKGILAHSLHVRAKETARGIVEHGGFNTPRVFQSDLLAERFHARYAYINDPGHGLASDTDQRALSVRAKRFDLKTNVGDQLMHTDMSDMRELIRHQPLLANMLTTNGDEHLAVAFLLTSFRDSLEFFYQKALASEGKVTPSKLADFRKAAASMALSDFASRIAPEFTDWFFEQEELEPNQRRKTPTGENFTELHQRAVEFNEDFARSLHQIGTGALAIIVSHSYFILAGRQYYEGFSSEKLDEMINSEGPPFPPHVGMIFYKEKDGTLVLDGEPNRIPPEFEIVGRRLRFKESTPQSVIDEACEALSIEEFRKDSNRRKSGNRKHSDHRFRFVIPPTSEDRPALARADRNADDSEKKAS